VIDRDHVHAAINHHQGAGDAFQDTRDEVFLMLQLQGVLLQSRLQAFSLGDVQHHSLNKERPTGIIPNNGRHEMRPNYVAIPRTQTTFQVKRFTSGMTTSHLCHHLLSIIGMKLFYPKFRICDPFVGSEPQHL
jgi:hypothetical protein